MLLFPLCKYTVSDAFARVQGRLRVQNQLSVALLPAWPLVHQRPGDQIPEVARPKADFGHVDVSRRAQIHRRHCIYISIAKNIDWILVSPENIAQEAAMTRDPTNLLIPGLRTL